MFLSAIQFFFHTLKYPYDQVYHHSIVYACSVEESSETIIYDRKFSLCVYTWAILLFICNRISCRCSRYDMVKIENNVLVNVHCHNGQRVLTDHDFQVTDTMGLSFRPRFLCADIVVDGLPKRFDVTDFMNTYIVSFMHFLKCDMHVRDIARLAFTLKYIPRDVSSNPNEMVLVVLDAMTLEETRYDGCFAYVEYS